MPRSSVWRRPPDPFVTTTRLTRRFCRPDGWIIRSIGAPEAVGVASIQRINDVAPDLGVLWHRTMPAAGRSLSAPTARPSEAPTARPSGAHITPLLLLSVVETLAAWHYIPKPDPYKRLLQLAVTPTTGARPETLLAPIPTRAKAYMPFCKAYRIAHERNGQPCHPEYTLSASTGRLIAQPDVGCTGR
jgi:hypothetical protein